MTQTTNKIEQNNTYMIYDSMGRRTGIYIMASNIKEACQLAKDEAKANKLGVYYKVKRCYSGGVRG
jgi:hypothetical protein